MQRINTALSLTLAAFTSGFFLAACETNTTPMVQLTTTQLVPQHQKLPQPLVVQG